MKKQITKGFIKELFKSPKTVFSFKDLCLLWESTDAETIKSRVNYYVKHGDLYHIRRGFYARDKSYNHFELATKIFTPAYISFETVLSQAGIIFQYYRQIFVASYKSKSITCDEQIYTFRSIKSVILTNALGIEIKENYSMACPERAFLDILYLHKNYHFDNLSGLNWDRVYEILPIYKNNRMKKAVEIYHNAYKSDVGEDLLKNWHKLSRTFECMHKN